MAQQLAGLAGILQNIQIPPGVYPTMIDLPAPPKLEGALGPNDLLAQARRHAYNRVLGPESMVIYKGFVYTGQANGWLVEISPFGAIRRLTRFASRACSRFGPRGGACGRPMGIRLDSKGFLIVADAYHGIFRVNPRSGRFRQLVHPRLHRPNNRPVRFINDLTISKDGLIFFTSSSTKWPLAREDNIVLEGENSGRVLYYNPRELRWNKQVQEVLTNLSFPTGIQLSKDDSYLLVGEGTRSRIHRIWLGPKPPKPQRLEVFADNLPGVVDKIRLSPRGTFWVGFSQSRHRGLPSVLDLFGRKPRIRGALITLMNSRVAFTKPRFGMVVELSEDGQVIRSLQDPRGKVYTSVSEVQEENGILFLASPGTTFIGFMKLSPSSAAATTTPSPDQSGSGTGSGSPGTGSPGSGTPGAGTGLGTPGSGGSGLGPPLGLGLSFPLSHNPKVIAFLMKVRNNVMRMTDRRIRQVVIELIKRLILTKRRAIILRRLADAREEDLQRIKEVLKQLQQNRPGPGDSGSMTTTMALPTVTDFSTSAAGEQETTTISGSQETTTVTSPGGTDETTTTRTDTTTTSTSPDFTTTTTTSSETSMGSDGTTSTTASPAGDTTPRSSETTSTTNAPDTTTTSTIQDSTTTTAAADSETTTTETTTTAAETTTTVAETETTTTEEPTTTTTTKTADD